MNGRRTAPTSAWRYALALVAACLLTFQTLAGANALGRGPMVLDAFGNPLCITSADRGGQPLPGHGSLLDCCTLGCAAAADVVGGAAESPGFALPVQIAETIAFADFSLNLARRPASGDGNPRAPPLA